MNLIRNQKSSNRKINRLIDQGTLLIVYNRRIGDQNKIFIHLKRGRNRIIKMKFKHLYKKQLKKKNKLKDYK